MLARFLLSLFLVATLHAQVWEPVPLVTAATRLAGFAGGEGGQWLQALVASPDGKVLLFGTDVGGIYRSADAGQTWTPSNGGLYGRGAADFAFDPANSSRVLMVAGNSLERPFHGLYLSEDGGISWKNVLPFDNLGYRDFRPQLAFDSATFDAATGRTQVAYWSSTSTKTRGKGFFKTTDGGNTWSELKNVSSVAGESFLKIHPQKGTLYIGNAKGLFRSTNQGFSFQKIFSQPVTGLDAVATSPDNIYLSTAKALFISKDSGDNFGEVKSDSFPPTIRTGVKRLRVSPADPQRMLLESDEDWWARHRYVTHDGGKTWTKGTYDNTHVFLPRNDREMVVAWHPTDPNTAWSIGGDFITRSTDGARNWFWSGSGYNGLMVGHSFTFNAQTPDLLALPSQDYDAAITTDAGHSWTRSGVSGENWGGYTYGAYAFSPDVVAAGSRTSWGGPSELRIRRGEAIERTGIVLDGEPVSLGDPSDASIVFLYNQRTADAGKTWHSMKNCRGVFTVDPTDSTKLYGTNGPSVVLSTDHGETWKEIVSLPGKQWVRDIAVDASRNMLHVVSHSDRLFRWNTQDGLRDVTERLPADQFGKQSAQSVATDPANPSIVYVVGAGNTYLKDTSAARSVDGGETFTNLTRNFRLGQNLDGPDGGLEAMWVRVHPTNHYAYTASNCFGVWRIAPPNIQSKN